MSNESSVQGALSHVFIAADDFHGVSKVMQLLGLDVLMGDPSDDGNYVRFGGNGGFHAGLESSLQSGNRPMVQLNIRVPDAEAAQQLLVENGIEAPEPREEPWGAKHCQFSVGAIELALTQD